MATYWFGAQPKFRKKIERSFDSPDIVRVEWNVHGWTLGEQTKDVAVDPHQEVKVAFAFKGR